MKPTTAVVLVVALAGLVAASGVAAADGATTGSTDASTAQDDLVTIQVQVSTPDGDPVSNAEVTIDWTGNDDPRTRTTLSDGTVRMDAPSSGEWEMRLEHDDYVRNFPITFSAADSDDVVEVTMYQAVSPTITVVDQDDEAVADADVALQKESRSHSRDAASGTTADDGTYDAPEIEAGEYELSVVKPGYYESVQTVTFGDTNQEHTVAIEEGTITIDLLVQDPTPEGPGTIEASVSFSRDGSQVTQVSTGEDGEATVALAVNTRYEISGEREGYTRKRRALTTGEERREYTINMTREPGISLELANTRVVAGQNLLVEVTDEYDRPVEGATVLVDGEERAETDDGGEARVEIPDQGEYEVTAEFGGHTSDPATVEGVTAAEMDDDGGGDTPDLDDTVPGPGAVGALLALLAAAALLGRRA